MSTIKKPPVDVVIVGFGWTGAIMGMELTDSGLQVLALERGERRDTYPDFAYPRIADELTYGIRLKLAQEMAHETVTIRHTPADFAVPYRQLGSFCRVTASAEPACTGTACTGAPCLPISNCTPPSLKNTAPTGSRKA